MDHLLLIPTRENMLQGLSAPIHPGALRYYAEAGAAVPEGLK